MLPENFRLTITVDQLIVGYKVLNARLLGTEGTNFDREKTKRIDVGLRRIEEIVDKKFTGEDVRKFNKDCGFEGTNLNEPIAADQ